jgi:hypothetical protein
VDGKFPFETTLLPFLIEAIKLGVSVVLLAIELGGARVCGRAVFAELTNLRNLAKYAVPALLYIVVNNLNVVMLLYSSPVEVSLPSLTPLCCCLAIHPVALALFAGCDYHLCTCTVHGVSQNSMWLQ